MESFDMFLNGNFVALEHFQSRYSVLVSEPGVLPEVYAIETKWQSSLFQSGA
jgi:SP family general alpha glucoside:H+ symporter-like MFS transporter